MMWAQLPGVPHATCSIDSLHVILILPAVRPSQRSSVLGHSLRFPAGRRSALAAHGPSCDLEHSVQYVTLFNVVGALTCLLS